MARSAISFFFTPLSLPKKSLYLHLVPPLLLETHSFLDQLLLCVCVSVSQAA